MPDFLTSQLEESGTSHLASNNPFRNRAVSPSLPQTPTSPFDDPTYAASTARPVSRNPFLDPGNGSSAAPKSNTDLLIDLSSMSTTSDAKSKSSVADIFSSLNIENKTIPATKMASMSPEKAPQRPIDAHSKSSMRPPPPGRGRPGGPPPRAKNIPPGRSPSPTHRPSRSQEEAMKRHHHSSNSAASGRAPPPGTALEGHSSSRRAAPAPRPRRNSESSIAPSDHGLSRGDKALRDIRRREQTLREKGEPRRTSRRNDIIDQLDATSIFGNVFHHDGPFDALNPHRNKHNRRAPMQAFPKDSLNNVLGGSGPLNSRPDHKTFMGQGEDEAFRDFASNRDKSSSNNVPVFDPTARGLILHGDQTLGLGTSTFLEGTPAARTAIQRKDAEKAQDVQDNPLQRKKSLAQRFRSVHRGQREPNSARAFSTDGARVDRVGGYGADRLDRPDRPFDEFDQSRGEDIITVRRKAPPLPSPPSPPQNALERRSTADAAIPMTDSPKHSHSAIVRGGTDEIQQRSTSGGGGLLARVKSLKGGRRAAPPPPLKDS